MSRRTRLILLAVTGFAALVGMSSYLLADEQRAAGAAAPVVPVKTAAGGITANVEGVPATQRACTTRSTSLSTVPATCTSPTRSNHLIRRVDTSGVITTFAGSGTPGFSGDGGPATAAELSSPGGVAWHNGSLYIADRANNRVRVVDASGTIDTFAGNGSTTYNGENIPAPAISLYGPYNVDVASNGDAYIVEHNRHRVIRVRASDGIAEAFAGR